MRVRFLSQRGGAQKLNMVGLTVVLPLEGLFV